MSTTHEFFEIEPFRHELENEARRGGGSARRVPRGPRGPATKPWPSFRKRRTERASSIYGGSGGYPDAADPEPQAGTEPASVESLEYVRWLQSTLNRAVGAALPIDGVMSATVRDAIRTFQQRNRLPASGYIGPDTEAALRRVGTGSGSNEFEFEWEFELSGDALAADRALSQSRALPIRFALKSLGKQTIPGLYRFFANDGRHYTGMAADLRRRIIQHLWCLSHLGVETKNHRLVLYRMDGKTAEQVRSVEASINKHYKGKNVRLNATTELEVLELSNL